MENIPTADETREQRKREQIEWRELHDEEEKQDFDKIMQLAKKLCPINYVKFCYEIQYKLHIDYNHTTKTVYSRYLDTLIGIGQLKKSDNGIVSLGEVK